MFEFQAQAESHQICLFYVLIEDGSSPVSRPVHPLERFAMQGLPSIPFAHTLDKKARGVLRPDKFAIGPKACMDDQCI